MTLLAIRLKNFMAYDDTGWLEIRPITLLFGCNSTGKSVISRAMHLLKQSIVPSVINTPFLYSVEDEVDLGSYLEIAHGENKSEYITGEKSISFSFRCLVPNELLRELPGSENQKPTVDLTLVFSWNNIQQTAYLSQLKYEVPWSAIKGEKMNTLFFAEPLDTDNNPGVNWWFDSHFLDEHKMPESLSAVWYYVSIETKPGFLPYLNAPDKFDGQSKDLDFVRKLFEITRQSILTSLNNLEHIRPVRPNPKRLYVLDDVAQIRWRKQGLNSWIKLLKGELSRDERKTANYWLGKLQLGSNLKVVSYSKIPGRTIVAEVIMDEWGNGIHGLNLSDFGYGIAQILPIVIDASRIKNDSLTIIEQPELHLHPRAQAELGDMFITSAVANVPNQFYILETHSEHLMLRFMRRMKNTYQKKLPNKRLRVTPDDIAVYVVTREKGSNRSDIHLIEFSDDGEMLDQWPGGFFDEDYNERFLY